MVEDERLVGIVTTNDFFYKIANPVLGIGKGGTRLEVIGKGDDPVVEHVVSVANKEGVRIVALHLVDIPKSPEGRKDLVVHLDTMDVTQIEEALKAKGYETIIRSCKVC